MWKEKGKCAVAIGFDFDAETLWMARGLKTASPMSRGKYGAYIGIPRILRLCRERDIKLTFFVPGWVAEHYGPVVEQMVAEGHEVAHHGWLHDDPNSMSVEQEEEEFLRGIEVFKKLGITPGGYRSPAFDLGPNTLNLLMKNKYLYDTSMMAHESPYFITENGADSGVIELPVSWELDDAPYYLFNIKPTYRRGMADPDMVVRVWQREFDWAYRESSFYLLTLHPQITGRGYRMDALGQVLDYIKKYPDVWITTHKEIAEFYKTKVDKKDQLKIDLALGWHDPHQK
jgi:peptidoglycan/xylan/chitin deacetylase (PgdA/CDA1 family)